MKYLIPALLFLSVNAEAQDTTTKYQLKLYNLTTLHRPTSFRVDPGGSQRYYTAYHQHQYLHPTVAFAWHNRKGQTHELELSDLAIEKTGTRLETLDSAGLVHGNPYTIRGDEAVRTAVALRYEHIIPLWRKKGWRLRPSLGVAAQPFYTRYRTIPFISAAYPETHSFLGLRTFAVPRVQYDLSEKIFLDLNVPLCLAEFSLHHVDYRNPAITGIQQRSGNAGFQMLPGFHSVRIGAGLRL